MKRHTLILIQFLVFSCYSCQEEVQIRSKPLYLFLEDDWIFVLNENVKSVKTHLTNSDSVVFYFDTKGRPKEIIKNDFEISWVWNEFDAHRYLNGEKIEDLQIDNNGNIIQSTSINHHNLQHINRFFYDDDNRMIKIEKDKNNIDYHLATYNLKTITYREDSITINYDDRNLSLYKFCIDKCGEPKTELKYINGTIVSIRNYTYTLDEHENWIKAIIKTQDLNNSSTTLDTVYREIEYYN